MSRPALTETGRSPLPPAAENREAVAPGGPGARAPGAPGAERESAGCALGVATGGLLVFGILVGLLAAAVLLPFAGGGDPDEMVATLFRAEGPPFGLVATESRGLTTGGRVVHLAREAGEGDERPNELYLVRYGSLEALERVWNGGREPGRGPRNDTAQEASARKREWEKDPSFEWHTTLASDEIAWRRWRATYRVERSFHFVGECRRRRYLVFVDDVEVYLPRWLFEPLFRLAAHLQRAPGDYVSRQKFGSSADKVISELRRLLARQADVDREVVEPDDYGGVRLSVPPDRVTFATDALATEFDHLLHLLDADARRPA